MFLAELSRHGVFARAARAASPHSKTGAIYSFRDLRDREAEFAAQVEEAMEHARAEVEMELHRRSVEGIDEPVYGTNGVQIGSRKRYSDKLLALRAQSMMPERYASRTVAQIEQTTTIKTRPSLGLDELSPESRADLRRILERELGRDADEVGDAEAKS
ncbi:MAG: hypothetical protein NTY35_16790 [Planctomycetota bacterium]|nr:hypothetical protein [Planctomycetota bacterium]